MSLATKYRPKTWEDVTEQDLVVKMLKNMCESELSNRCFLLTGPAGTGKAQPLDSHVLTPNGFIEMRDVEVGTEVITGQGHIGKVSGVYPQGARPIYELVLSDGGSIRVADLHLNVIYVEGSISVVTTDYLVHLFGDGFTLYIPRADLSNYSCSTDDIPDTDEYREIEDINYVGKEDCQCIMIGHDDHTYVSDDYILTHNTTTGRLIATYLNGSTDNLIEIDAASNNGVDAMRELVQQASTYPIGTKYKIILIDEIHTLSPQAFQVLLKTFEEQPAKSVFILCVDGDGLVCTEHGMVPIKDVSVGDKVWDGETYQNVLNVFDNGYRDTLKITLSNGSYFICTPNHEISVLSGDKLVWKRADELTDSDYILDYYNYRVSSQYSCCSLEEAWFLGYLTGNGHYTDHSMDLYTPFHKWEKVKYYLDKLVEQDIIEDYIQSSDDRAFRNHIYDTRIHFKCDKYHPRMREWYDKVKLNPNYTRGKKCVPKIMFSESVENIVAFIEGWYFADGDGQYDSYFDCNKKNVRGDWIGTPSIICSSESMISDLQQLLRIIGIHSSVRHRIQTVSEKSCMTTNISPGSYSSYTIYVLRKYGFIDSPEFKKILTDVYNNLPSGIKKYKLDLSNITHRGRNVSPKMLDEAGYDFNSKGRFFRVDSIEKFGTSHVYDIEVEHSHKFVYNGVLVHNCTTNPEKIPATIISRVQTFQLSKISLEGIFNRLKYVLDSEIKEGANITYTDDAILFLSKISSGGMRDALTSLDKVLSYSKDVTTENLVKALNLPNYDDYFKLLGAYAKHDNAKISELVDQVYNSGVNFTKWFEGFHGFVINVVKYIYLQDIQRTVIPSYYQDRISKYSVNHVIICLKLANKLVELNNALKTTQYLQETALTYLCSIPQKQVTNNG